MQGSEMSKHHLGWVSVGHHGRKDPDEDFDRGSSVHQRGATSVPGLPPKGAVIPRRAQWDNVDLKAHLVNAERRKSEGNLPKGTTKEGYARLREQLKRKA